MKVSHLRKQAKNLSRLYPELLEANPTQLPLAAALATVARMNGYPSWEILVARKQDQDTNDGQADSVYLDDEDETEIEDRVVDALSKLHPSLTREASYTTADCATLHETTVPRLHSLLYAIYHTTAIAMVDADKEIEEVESSLAALKAWMKEANEGIEASVNHTGHTFARPQVGPTFEVKILSPAIGKYLDVLATLDKVLGGMEMLFSAGEIKSKERHTFRASARNKVIAFNRLVYLAHRNLQSRIAAGLGDLRKLREEGDESE